MRISGAVIAFLAIFGPPASAAEWPPAENYIPIFECPEGDYKDDCEYTRKKWADEYKAATDGKYQGQRNVAYCLSDGCLGAIHKNEVLGCAWRIVILKSGHLEIDSTDTSNFKTFCGGGHLDDAGREAANAQAARILSMLPRPN